MINSNFKRCLPRLLLTIGAIPTSYLVSMTYEEQLLWLCNFLEKTLIPKVNDNTEAINLLNKALEELREYVNNYFDNLDIQQEIDNKIQQMIDDGTFEAIILEFLNVNSILGYKTLNDLKNADNLIDGTITKTLGKTNYIDGLGEFYLIRTKTSSDVIDEDNIISLTNHNELVGVKIPDANITNINNRIDILSNVINNKFDEIDTEIEKLKNKKYVFIGDSYDAQVDPSNPSSIKWWSTVIVEVLELSQNDYIRSSNGGASFGNNSNTFKDLIDVLSYDESVTDVLIAGGYNDQYYDYEHISNGAWACNSAIKNKFPNAKIHVAFIGNSTSSSTKLALKETLQKYLQVSNAIGWHYINNSEYSMQDYSNSFLADGVHPSVYGATIIGRNLAKGLLYDVADIQFPEVTLYGHSSYTDGDGSCDSFAPGSFKCNMKNGVTSISALSLSIFGFLDNVNYIPNGSNELILGTIENGYIKGTGDLCEIPVTGRAGDGTYIYNIAGNLKIKNGRLILSFLCIDNTGYHNFTNLKQIVLNHFSVTLPTENC